jgi:hypothetical protein
VQEPAPGMAIMEEPQIPTLKYSPNSLPYLIALKPYISGGHLWSWTYHIFY